jgi:hypothetical protein
MSGNATNSTAEGYNCDNDLVLVLNVEDAVFRIMILVIIANKVYKNRNAIYKNKLFALYFILLSCGNILILVSGLLLAYLTLAESILTLQITFIIGLMLTDAFFGLIPNFFYSIYKTKLSADIGSVTKKYFIGNGAILTIFTLLTIIIYISLDGEDKFWSNVVLMVQLLYTLSFYVLTIKTLSNLKDNKIVKVLTKYLFYYAGYVIILFIRFGLSTQYIMNPNVSLVYISIIENVMTGYSLLIISVFLRLLKFSKKKKDIIKTGSDSTGVTKSIE